LQTQTENGSGNGKNIPEKVWKSRGRRLDFSGPDGAGKKNKKINQGFGPGEKKKGLPLHPSPERGTYGRRLLQSARKAPESSLKYCRKTKTTKLSRRETGCLIIRIGTTNGAAHSKTTYNGEFDPGSG
jgi:hypothetical protein